MALSNIPQLVWALFKSVQATDYGALRRAISDHAIIRDRGSDYQGADAIQRCVERFTRYGTVNIRPINLARRSGTVMVTAIVQGTGDADSAGSGQLDWRFSINGRLIDAVTIQQTAWPDMPPAVTAFIRATNTSDIEGLLKAFSDDALVNDQFRNYWGKENITQWAARDVIGERMTMYVVSAQQLYGCTILTANVDGDYDKRGLPDPLALEFFFETVQARVVQLIVLRHHD